VKFDFLLYICSFNIKSIVTNNFNNFKFTGNFRSNKLTNKSTLESKDKSLDSLINKVLNTYVGMITRNGGRPFIGYLISKVAYMGLRVTKFKLVLISSFVFHCSKVLRHEGRKGLVMNLKVSQVLIQQSVAKYVINDMNPLKRRVRRSRSGFPKWIIHPGRLLLRSGDLEIIRLYMTLTGLYRVINFPGKVDLSSITDTGPGLSKLSKTERNVLDSVINRC
jgi:hypothetical protein